MATVTIRIQMGNDAMQTGSDLAAALRKLAAHVEGYEKIRHPSFPPHSIRDENGNTVGKLKVVR